MKKPRVACLGPEESFTHLAAKSYFGEQANYHYLPPLKACKAIRQNEVEFAIAPVENNTAGFVEATLDALYRTGKIIIMDEIYLPIRQQLISNAGDINKIELIYSNAIAFAQCRRNLEEIEKERRGRLIKQIQVESTSLGVSMASKDTSSAAIGSETAAAKYKVPILRSNLHDNKHNTTRFFVIKIGTIAEPTGNDRSAFLFEVKHQPGALNKILDIFAKAKINLLSFQSRPACRVDDTKWDYAFFLECEGHIWTEPLKNIYKVLQHSEQLSRPRQKVRCLGSFPNRLKRNNQYFQHSNNL